MEMKLERLSHSINGTEKLRKLILENPDLPIVFSVDSEVVCDSGYNSWLVPSIQCHIGEILDCEQDINDERIFLDRIEFEEEVEDYVYNSHDFFNETSQEEMDREAREMINRYEPYWKKCIIVAGGV